MPTKSNQTPAITAAIALAFSLTITTGAAAPVQWPVLSGGNGHFYEAIHATNGITWQNASNAAVSLGGYLATPTNAAENNFVYSLVSGDDSFWVRDSGNNGVGPWLGGYLDPSQGANGTWRWVTGEVFSYVPWAPGEPNNYLDENRIHFLGTFGALKSSQWNDYADDPLLTARPRPLGYIVEWTTTPPPTVSISYPYAGICWTSYSNVTYRVDYKTNVTATNWFVLRSCVLDSGTQTCLYDRVLSAQSNKFYRVVVTNCVPGP